MKEENLNIFEIKKIRTFKGGIYNNTKLYQDKSLHGVMNKTLYSRKRSRTAD